MRFSIYRYNPETGQKPTMQDIELDFQPEGKMLLDAILALKELDPTLSVRRSCREGVCGSDAMNINGQNGLACITPLADLKQPITLRPLPGLPVIRDLIVDLTQFYQQYRSIQPYLIEKSPRPEKERLQSAEDRERFDDTTKCILCGACTTSCPSFWADPNYVGPAAIVQAHRFLFASRDEGKQERLATLNGQEGVWRCRTVFNCVEACPRGINVTRAIGEVKLALLKGKV